MSYIMAHLRWRCLPCLVHSFKRGFLSFPAYVVESMDFPLFFLHQVFLHISVQELLYQPLLPVDRYLHPSNKKCTPFTLPYPAVKSRSITSPHCFSYYVAKFVSYYVQALVCFRFSIQFICVALYPFILYINVLAPTFLQVVDC
jgi:hypothetical protein